MGLSSLGQHPQESTCCKGDSKEPEDDSPRCQPDSVLRYPRDVPTGWVAMEVQQDGLLLAKADIIVALPESKASRPVLSSQPNSSSQGNQLPL